MIYKLGILLVVVTYTSVTSALPPCVCTREMKPVCGSDGQSYNNMCMLRCQQQNNPSLQLVSHGRCRSIRDIGSKADTCICTLEYRPVCGSDGRTYPNKCAMECNNEDLQVVHYGECKQKQKRSCICPYNYDPVCGTNGHTYPNQCALNCEGPTVQLAYNGECRAKREVDYEPPTCFCTFENDPVCGTNGHTYGNMCALKCEQGKVQVAHKGACVSKRESVQVAALPPCHCTREARFVCGTDGKTYSNPCLLNCVREQNEDLHIDYTGPCKNKRTVSHQSESLPSCACSRELKPLCASNGVTYNNECLMKCAGSDLTVEKYEPCDDE